MQQNSPLKVAVEQYCSKKDREKYGHTNMAERNMVAQPTTKKTEKYGRTTYHKQDREIWSQSLYHRMMLKLLRTALIDNRLT
uniref:Uncharacterized protein n=1 Tax=Arion vulgaris TaxID=1028688 RepID=A0A0B7BUQ6_9EUPU